MAIGSILWISTIQKTNVTIILHAIIINFKTAIVSTRRHLMHRAPVDHSSWPQDTSNIRTRKYLWHLARHLTILRIYIVREFIVMFIIWKLYRCRKLSLRQDKNSIWTLSFIWLDWQIECVQVRQCNVVCASRVCASYIQSKIIQAERDHFNNYQVSLHPSFSEKQEYM